MSDHQLSDDELAPRKGERGGQCNRTACTRPEPAEWFNRSTRKWYCVSCATELNRVNAADAQRLFEGPLCISAKEVDRRRKAASAFRSEKP